MKDAAVEVRLATADDSAEIVALVRRCYGDTYCWREGLDPGAIAARIREGDLAYAVARTREGEHVAQVAIERRGAHGLFDHGRAIVTPSFRRRGLFAAMDAVLIGRHAR